MPEPIRSRLRPIPMTRTLTTVLAALLLVSACGSAEERSGAETAKESTAPASPSPSTSADSGCTPPEGATRVVTVLAEVDLDGDGTPDPVGLTGAKDPCPGQLSAEVGERTVALAIPDSEPPVTSAFAVAVPGRTSQLVVTRQDHPRGGFQTRVFALGPDGLVQLENEGRPLVPFVATDVQEQPSSIDCQGGDIVVTSAVPHEPSGVVFAWDIRRTTYELHEASVTAGATEEIADNVLPKQLTQRYPQLVKHAVFPSCRV